jgi:hypothetical protein
LLDREADIISGVVILGQASQPAEDNCTTIESGEEVFMYQVSETFQTGDYSFVPPFMSLSS